MKHVLTILIILFSLELLAQTGEEGDAQMLNRENFQYLSSEDLQFLEQMTRDVLELSRIYPGQEVTPAAGPNNTGGTLIRPGGRDCYPAFWIRDYAMALETGLIPPEEQKHMLRLTAETQCDQARITSGGGLVPAGAIADHIQVATREPMFYPGSQAPKFGILPTLDDHFYFIHMAYHCIREAQNPGFLQEAIDGTPLIRRLEMAYRVPTTRGDSPLVYTTEHLRGVDFGFRDVMTITGDLCFTSILKYRASLELAWLFEQANMDRKAQKYRGMAAELKALIPEIFSDSRGMLKASTGKSGQPDVWGTALAVYYGILDGKEARKTSRFLADAYNKGTLAYKGNIRHVLTTDDFSDSTAWEVSYWKKNTYQNGAYWGTPVGWVAYTIALTDPAAARKIVGEYIAELRANDYRKGDTFGAPWECFHPNGHKQNPVYLATVACPYAVFRNHIGRTDARK